MSGKPTNTGSEPVTVHFTYQGSDYRLELSPTAASRFAKVGRRGFESADRRRARTLVGTLLHRSRSAH